MTAKKSMTLDGWVNFLTGLGDPKKDARLASMFTAERLTYDGCLALYEGNDCAAKIVDRPAADMVRAWFDFKSEGDKKRAELLEKDVRRLKAQEAIRQALQWKRAYGGAIVLVGANDGQADLSKPLDEKNVKAIDYLNVFDCRDASVREWYENPFEKNFGTPRVYDLNPAAIGTSGIAVMSGVHESRVLRFCGPIPSRRSLVANQGWGDSVLQRVHGVLRDFGVSWESAAALVVDFSLAIYKIKGLQEAMASDNEGLVQKRWAIIDMCKSAIRGVLLDAEGEDYERKPTPITGLPELLDRFCMRVASAGELPTALLFGRSAGGLNGESNGEADVRFYYDGIDERRQFEVVPQVERLFTLLQLAKTGPTKGSELKNWSIAARPLWQPDAKTIADTRLVNAQADKAYVEAGVLLPEWVTESRFGGDSYGEEIRLPEGWEADMSDAEQAEAEALLAQSEALAASQGDEEPAPRGKSAGKAPKPPAGKPGA